MNIQTYLLAPSEFRFIWTWIQIPKLSLELDPRVENHSLIIKLIRSLVQKYASRIQIQNQHQRENSVQPQINNDFGSWNFFCEFNACLNFRFNWISQLLNWSIRNWWKPYETQAFKMNIFSCIDSVASSFTNCIHIERNVANAFFPFSFITKTNSFKMSRMAIKFYLIKIYIMLNNEKKQKKVAE